MKTSSVAVARLILANLPAIEDDLTAGAVVFLSDNRLRIRRLPLPPMWASGARTGERRTTRQAPHQEQNIDREVRRQPGASVAAAAERGAALSGQCTAGVR